MKRFFLAVVAVWLAAALGAQPAAAQSYRVPVLLSGASDPYPGATVALDFIGSNTNGQPYCRVGGSAAPCSSLLTTSRASIGYGECNGQLILFQANQPRITCQGLLAEEARTNLLLRSQDLTIAPWGRSSITVSGPLAAPDGSQTAQLLTPVAASGLHDVAQSLTAVSGTTYALAAYVKAGGTNFAVLNWQNATTQSFASAVFNVATCSGAATETKLGITSGTIVSTLASPEAGGWCRITLVATVSGATTFFYCVGPAPLATGNTFSAGGEVSWNASGAETITEWQADAQAGPFITSPILTTSATATRPADSVSIGGITGPAAVTWVTESTFSAIAAATRVASYTNGGAYGAPQGLTLSASNGSGFSFGGNGSSITASSAYSAGQTVRAAGAADVATTAQKISVAGAATVKNSTLDYTGVGTNSIQLGALNSGVTQPLNGYLRKLIVYPRFFSDAELQAASQ